MGNVRYRKVLPCLTSVAAVSFMGCAHRIPVGYAGQFVLKSSGKNMMLLDTAVHGHRLTGTLTTPKYFTEGADGEFSGISLPVTTSPVTGKWKHGQVQLLVGSAPDLDQKTMTLSGPNRIALSFFPVVVPALNLERVPDHQKISVSSDWPLANTNQDRQ